MIRRPPSATRPCTLFPDTSLFRASSRVILTRSDVASLTANQSCYLLFERLLARRGRRPFEEVANLCNCSCRVLIDSRRCCNISARDFSSSLSRARSDASQSRSEEHPSELQYLMRRSYAVFCLKKKKRHHDGIFLQLWTQ